MENLVLNQIRTFLAINYADLVTILILVVIVVLASRQIYKRRKSGACSSCPNSKSCVGAKNTAKPKNCQGQDLPKQNHKQDQ